MICSLQLTPCPRATPNWRSGCEHRSTQNHMLKDSATHKSDSTKLQKHTQKQNKTHIGRHTKTKIKNIKLHKGINIIICKVRIE